MALHYFPQEFGPVHPRHAHVRHHDIERRLAHQLKGLGAAVHKHHFPCAAHVSQHALEPLQNERLIIHKKDPLLHAAFLSCAVTARGRGSRIAKVVPLPTSVSKVMVPPCLSATTECAMAKPWPVPLPTALVVKNGSKIRSRTCFGIPAPVSPTQISAQSPR